MAKAVKDRVNPDLYGNNVYRAKTTLPWLWRYGRDHRGETHTLVKRDAEQIAKDKIRDIKAQAHVNKKLRIGPMAWGVGMDKWWERRGRHLVQNDPALLAEFDWLKATIGPEVRCENIDGDVLSDMLGKRERCLVPHTDRPVSAATVNGTLTLTRTVLNFLNKVHKVAIHPNDWKALRLKTEKQAIRFVEESELALILAELRGDVLDVVEFALTAGKRIDEIISLTWSKVNADRQTISVRVKGDKPVDAPMSKAAWAVIERQRGRHEEFVFTFVAERTRPYRNPVTKEVVREQVKGQRFPMSYAVIDRQLRKACRKLGIAGVSCHTLRHTAATWLLRDTGDLTKVQEMCDHSSINITREFYAATIETNLREGLDKLGASVGKFFRPAPTLVVDNTAKERA